MTKEQFGVLTSGEQASLYKISCGQMEASITDFGATLVSLMVPDKNGKLADVVLGFDNANDYAASDTFFGATVGRNANRIAGASFSLGEHTYTLEANNNGNNLHSGSTSYAYRLWNVLEHTESTIILTLESPDGDQGFPGNATVRVTYALEAPGTLSITYDAVCNADTVFNMTNHSYFNLAGHENGDKALTQILSLGARVFSDADENCLPTGKLCSVEGTPMDFRTPKPIGRDINADYETLKLQGGYDHNFEVFGNPCATLSDPESGRIMHVVTDCPGLQFYTGNFINDVVGKGGVSYAKHSGVCLETQYYPDAVHFPELAQPVVKAGESYHSETKYIFA